MKICDLHTGAIRLTRATKSLRDQWLETSDFWGDQNRQEFARAHFDPIGPEVTLTLAAVQRLAELLEQAERECSDEHE